MSVSVSTDMLVFGSSLWLVLESMCSDSALIVWLVLVMLDSVRVLVPLLDSDRSLVGVSGSASAGS